MSGIKISELNKWSISDVESVDAKDILIPVSINAVTGCLRSNVLVSFLNNEQSYIDSSQNIAIAELSERISYLTSTFNTFATDMTRKYNELLAIQSGIDSVQTSQINQNTSDITNINQINDEQSAQINAMSEWEIINHNNG